MSLSRKTIAALLALAVAVFALAACGDDDEDSGDSSVAETTTTEATTEETTETGGGAAAGGGEEAGGGAETGGVGQTVDIEADPSSLAYTTGDLETAAGEVTVNFDNPADIGHDVRVEDSAGNDIGGTEVITNDTATATVTLEPGDYTYFCSVPGHRPGGMEGGLTAK